mmetsp:Transcript_18621/g.25094  ORF Transcript_18621/g.25094 Transcript_18621/m.25094 type:complete len:87 (-) Transcript_18621:653-913(-)
MGTFLKLTIPGAVMQASYWWAQEMIIFQSGMVDIPSTSAACLILILQFLLDNLEFGLASTQVSFISNLFGKGKISEAIRYAKIATL